MPIYAVSPNEWARRKMQIYWGVTSVAGYEEDSTENIISHAMYIVRRENLVKKGDIVVFTAGDPATNMVNGEGAVTNIMRLFRQNNVTEHNRGDYEKMNKKPFVTKEQLDEITAKFPTPYHLYDEKGIRDNAKAVKEAFAWNKGYREYFAVKACPNPTLIQIMKEYGCGCDCSSMTELMLSKAMGCKGADIMFSSNATPAEEYQYAAKLGAIINLDDITHIEFSGKSYRIYSGDHQLSLQSGWTL